MVHKLFKLSLCLYLSFKCLKLKLRNKLSQGGRRDVSEVVKGGLTKPLAFSVITLD